jgi:hypothetical protein
MEEYYTYASGFCPYKVTIENNTIVVYKSKNIYLNDYDSKPLIKYQALEIFIGESREEMNSDYGGRNGEQYDGNSILIKVDHLKYVFIGDIIYNFTTDKEIIDYVSPVNNSGISYPYAIDKEWKYYLMIEDVILTKVDDDNKFDPYNYYYTKYLIVSDDIYKDKHDNQDIIHNVKNFYIDDVQYSLTYTADPESNYNRLQKEVGNNIKIEDFDGVKQSFSKKEYASLINYFGKKSGFEKLKNKILLE